MADINEVLDVLINRIKQTDDKIDDYPNVDDDRKKLVDELGTLAKALNEVQTAKATKDKYEAECEQMVRMNDEEIEMKKAQLENDTERLAMEKMSAKQNFKIKMVESIFTGAQLGLQASAIIGYFGLARRTSAHEYRISDGSSITPPRDVLNANGKLERFMFNKR